MNSEVQDAVLDQLEEFGRIGLELVAGVDVLVQDGTGDWRRRAVKVEREGGEKGRS
jgi:hypothetical protein